MGDMPNGNPYRLIESTIFGEEGFIRLRMVRHTAQGFEFTQLDFPLHGVATSPDIGRAPEWMEVGMWYDIFCEDGIWKFVETQPAGIYEDVLQNFANEEFDDLVTGRNWIGNILVDKQIKHPHELTEEDRALLAAMKITF